MTCPQSYKQTERAKWWHLILKFPVQLSNPFKTDNFSNIGVRSLHHQSHLLLENSYFSQTMSWKRSHHYLAHSMPPQSIGSSRSSYPLLKVYPAIYQDCFPLPAMFPLLHQFYLSSCNHILCHRAGFCQCGFQAACKL